MVTVVVLYFAGSGPRSILQACCRWKEKEARKFDQNKEMILEENKERKAIVKARKEDSSCKKQTDALLWEPEKKENLTILSKANDINMKINVTPNSKWRPVIILKC